MCVGSVCEQSVPNSSGNVIETRALPGGSRVLLSSIIRASSVRAEDVPVFVVASFHRFHQFIRSTLGIRSSVRIGPRPCVDDRFPVSTWHASIGSLPFGHLFVASWLQLNSCKNHGAMRRRAGGAKEH